jgi:hypothetical protein
MRIHFRVYHQDHGYSNLIPHLCPGRNGNRLQIDLRAESELAGGHKREYNWREIPSDPKGPKARIEDTVRFALEFWSDPSPQCV